MPSIKIPGATAAEVDNFFSEYAGIQKYILDRFEEIASAHGPYAEDRIMKASMGVSINMRDFIGSILPDSKDKVMQNYRRLFQFDDMLKGESGIQDLLQVALGETPKADSHLMEIGSDVGTGRVLKFRVSEGNIIPGKKRNPLTTILRDINIQVDKAQVNRLKSLAEQGKTIADDEVLKAFKFGGNIMSADYLRGLDRLVSGEMAIPTGSNMMIFDTETLGLSLGKGNIRQVSAASMMSGGKAGFDDVTTTFDKHFATSSSQTGMIRSPELRQNRKLFEYFSDLADGNMVRDTGSGEAFVNEMKNLLRQMNNSDYIMGHNVQFDIGQVLAGTKMTSQYLNGTDEELVKLVDEVTSKIGSGNFVVDTMHLARQKLPLLESAPELVFSGKKTVHSLENLMLQTNLIDLMVEEAGGGSAGRDAVLSKLGVLSEGGMHQADVDTFITAKLYKYMESDRLVAQGLGSESGGRVLSAAEKGFYGQLRTFVRRSYAPTPISNIADIRNIDDSLFEALLAEETSGAKRMRFGALDAQRGLMDELRLSSTSAGGSQIYSVGREGSRPIFSGTAAEMKQALSGLEDPFFMYADITPIEQEAFLTRNLVGHSNLSAVSEDTFFNLGTFRRMTGVDSPYEGLINKVGTFFKRNISAGQYSDVSKALENAGMPFSGLSLPEMMITNSMARATASTASRLRGGTYGKVAKIADDIGISHFELWDEAMVTGSGKVQLPVEILRSAGILGESDEMLSLSPFDYIDKASGEIESRVNLTRSLNDDELEKLIGFLDQTGEGQLINDKPLYQYFTRRGKGTDKIRLIEGLRETGSEYGVAIGGLAGDEAEQINAVLKDSILFDQFARDTDKIPFKVRLLDMFTGEGEGRMARVGPMVVDRFMGQEEKAAYANLSSHAKNMLDDLVERAGTPGGERLLQAAEFAANTGKGDLAKTVFETYKTVRKASPYVLAGAAIGVGAFLFAKKKKQAEFYDETTDTQSYESSGDYIDYRRQMGMSPAPARRLPDPLLTSYVVGNLDKSKIGHTQMGNQKYAHLFR